MGTITLGFAHAPHFREGAEFDELKVSQVGLINVEFGRREFVLGVASQIIALGRFDSFGAPWAMTAVCAFETWAMSRIDGIVLKKPSADASCDNDQGGRFEPFASCGEDRRRERDKLRQFPEILGCGRQ